MFLGPPCACCVFLRCVAAFSLTFGLVVVMCHARAVRFVHAFFSDVVVRVSALLSRVLFLLSLSALFLFLSVSCSELEVLVGACLSLLPQAVWGIRLLEVICMLLFKIQDFVLVTMSLL